MAEILQVLDRYFIHNVPGVPHPFGASPDFSGAINSDKHKNHKKLGNDTYLFKLMISIPHISPA